MGSRSRSRSRPRSDEDTGPRFSEIPSSRDRLSEADFFGFIAERHAIWHRKNVLKEEPPWTKDPILDQYHFCNVYRDLDYGTRWYKRYVAPAGTGKNRVLWRTVVYRLVNNIEVFRAWEGRVPDHHNRDWQKFIGVLRRKKIVPGTPAHMSLARPQHLHTKIDRLEWLIAKWDREFPFRAPLIYGAASLQEVSEQLQDVYGIGPFNGLQMYRDLLFAGVLPRFKEDDWVEIGPGAAAGLEMLYGKVPRNERRDRTYDLTLRQGKFLGSRWARYICVGDIEHALCEFAKYQKFKAGTGRRRYYRPRGRLKR